MSLPRIKVALQALIGLDNAPSNASNKAGAAGELIRRAASFWRELDRGGRGDILRRRSMEFERITSPGSPLDERRARALTLIRRHDDRIRLRRETGHVRPKRSIIIDTGIVFEPAEGPLRIPEDELDGMIVRLGNCETVRWELWEALEDMPRLLRLKWKPRDKQCLLNWEAELWSVRRREEVEHLFGSFLILTCHQAYDSAQGGPAALRELTDRVTTSCPRIGTLIQEAAQDAFLFATQGRRGTQDQQNQSATRWYHEKTEEPPQAYSYGPLEGKKIDLSEAVQPVRGGRPDGRVIKRKAESGVIWVRRLSGQSWEIYYKNKDLFGVVKDRLRQLTERRGGEKTAQRGGRPHDSD